MPAQVRSRDGAPVMPRVSSSTAALAASYAIGFALMGVATSNGLPAKDARAAVDLGAAILCVVAFRRWVGAGDMATRRFWRLMAWSALAVAGYCVAGALADLTGTAWLAVVAVVPLAAMLPMVVVALGSRASRHQGRNAGWGTVLDVSIVVLSVSGPFAFFLISPAYASGDLRQISLSGLWLFLLFGTGAFMLAAYRSPANRSPAGLAMMSAMLAVLTIAAFVGAFALATVQQLPPWWADALYSIGLLAGIDAHRYDVEVAARDSRPHAMAGWALAREALPYVLFIPLIAVTTIAALSSNAGDFVKSVVATTVAVSLLVVIRQFLQVLDNRRLVNESIEMLESSRRSEAEIDRLSKAKSEVMSNLNHEFRNALVGIQGFSEMMRDQELPPEDVKEFATDIFNDSQRLARMISDMLDIDRMEAGRVKLDLKPVDVNAKIEEAVRHAQASGGKCRIDCELDRNVPILQADPDRIYQVLSNLLSNAIKFSPDGGVVSVSSALEGGLVHVSVKDAGVGMRPEDLPKLFQRYERVATPDKKISGTGLGLVIVRQIVEMHGGRVWAESEPGRGSTFHFTIPSPPAVARIPGKAAA